MSVPSLLTSNLYYWLSGASWDPDFSLPVDGLNARSVARMVVSLVPLSASSSDSFPQASAAGPCVSRGCWVKEPEKVDWRFSIFMVSKSVK